MNVEEEIRKIQERNQHVEQDKAWETSWFRRLVIMTVTFCTAALFLKISGINNNLKIIILSSIIPSFAFLLSTLTLPPLKKLWGRWRGRSQ